jgi:hypothetical protein
MSFASEETVMNQEKPQSVTETKLCINTAQMRMFAMNYITHVIYGAHDDKWWSPETGEWIKKVAGMDPSPPPCPGEVLRPPREWGQDLMRMAMAPELQVSQP